MHPPSLSADEIEQIRTNFTLSEEQDEHLQRCWKHQNCDGCLDEKRCSWCPLTWACVPNSHKIPLLAPAYENICPHKSERWEIRSRPFGCQVSSVTSFTGIISAVSTLVFVAIVFLLVFLFRRLRRYSKRNPGWWRRPFKRHWWSFRGAGEREPLLATNGVNGTHEAVNGGP